MSTLVVAAHADDEVAFLWPALCGPDIKPEILICSGRNAQVPGHEGKGRAAVDLWEPLGVRIHVLDYADGFSEQRVVAGFCEELRAYINAAGVDQVFTHNPLGEYGHPDHKLVHEVCLQSDVRFVLFSDIWHRRGWTPWTGIRRKSHWRHVGQARLEPDWLAIRKRHYEERGLWTWGGEVTASCELYYL